MIRRNDKVNANRQVELQIGSEDIRLVADEERQREHEPAQVNELVVGTARQAGQQLRQELERSLAELLPPGTRAALVNYPNHNNVGDPALYVGTGRVLRTIGVRITYRCELRTYSRQTLRRELDRGTDVILINGGGNLGDQYPQQELRERVLLDFPSTRTIQLPQSIWFQAPDRLASFAKIVANHRDFTLFLRDRESVKLATGHFSAPLRLAPDLAFGLDAMDRPHSASTDIVWLRRIDRESRGTPPIGNEDAEPVDWIAASPDEAIGDTAGKWLLRTNQWLSRQVTSHPWLWRPLASTYDPLAARRLSFGCRVLARGRVVVTDRLHGVILSLLMGIPVVAVDNSTGKVASFIDTWLADAPNVCVAADHQAGLALARSWIRGLSR